MKLLVISHNVFCNTESMGKTLTSYFGGWNISQIAQFYIHSEVPVSDDVCEKYFRITDTEAFKSIFLRRCGREFGKTDIAFDRISPRTDTGALAKVYQKGRKRTPLIYLIRNAIWLLSNWNNRKLKKWLDDFNPDIIFFASGDYSFLYRIALKISKQRKIPMVVSCMDDYYFNNKNENKFLGKFSHFLFMKQVKKTLDYASAVFCICEKMRREYSSCFGWKCYTLHTAATMSKVSKNEKGRKISYIGNLGYQRYIQLIQLGQALKELNLEEGPKGIDVYSSEPRKEIVSSLSEENGIFFHGQIPYEKVKDVMGESIAVIHTESFDEEMIRCVRYSVSTKIADSLASGICILAYGPDNIASVEYLVENEAAYYISDEKEIKQKLINLLTDTELKGRIEKNALMLAERNHNYQRNAKYVKEIIEKIIGSERE